MEDEEREEIRRDGERERRNLFIIKTKKRSTFYNYKKKEETGRNTGKQRDLPKGTTKCNLVTLRYNENENCKMKVKKKKQ